MSDPTVTSESARQAFGELQRYLADEIPPLTAAEAAEVVVRLPAKYGAEIVRRWVETQLTAPDRVASVSGYVFHAVKKFHHLSEVGVVDRGTMDRYVTELSRAVVRMVPEREQTELRLKLSRITEVETTLSSRVTVLNRVSVAGETPERVGDLPEGGGGPRPAARATSPRLRMLLGRLDEVRETLAADSTSEEAQSLLARVVAKAAAETGDAEALREVLAQVRSAGVEASLDRKMFRLIGNQLPEWGIGHEEGGAPTPNVRLLLDAMRRIVALSGSREEGLQRFSEMVYAAIDQLNEGHLAQAVAMLDVAQGLIDDKQVDGELARVVKNRAQVAVALTPLRRFSAAAPKHGLLRKVLWFFPAFSPEALLNRIDGEPKRETRKLLLSLIEAHGPPCRPLLLDRLTGYLRETIPDPHGFYARNAIFLLRRIPRGNGSDLTRELDLLRAFAEPDRPFMVKKEAVGAIAAVDLPEAEALLLERLEEYEKAAVRGAGSDSPEETAEIFDRTCVALTARGSRDAVRAVAKHASLRDPRLGDTFGRLRHLSGADLSHDPDLVARLLEALRKSLPSRVLGVVVGGRSPETEALVASMSGTKDPRVISLFEEIATRYEGRPFAEAAFDALGKLRAGPVGSTAPPDAVPAESMTGDLEVFGLPALLQSLGDVGQTGRLFILEKNGQPRATMIFRDGKIATCETGPLRGLDAVAQLMERPRPGTFRFEKASPADLPPRGLAMDVLATILEAIRRHDEFQEDRALVPEGSTLMPGSTPASTPEGEEDEEFVKLVWREAAKGTAPETCEEVVGSDAYRVRRLYAHWFETGALRRRPAA